VLRPELLVGFQFFLGEIFFSGADVGLRQAVVDVGKVGIEVAGPQIFGDGFGIFALVRIQIAELQMGFCQIGSKRNGFFQEGFDLREIDVGILRAFALPETDRVVIESLAESARSHLRLG